MSIKFLPPDGEFFIDERVGEPAPRSRPPNANSKGKTFGDLNNHDLDALAQKHDAKPGKDDDLTEMNDAYAVTKVGGKTKVMQLEESTASPGCKVPVFSSIQDFCNFHLKRKKNIGTAKAPKIVGFGKWWINHSDRRQFDGVVYAPEGTKDNMLNLWTGFSCKPVEGDCDLYLNHLRDNVCDGNDAHFQYLIRWMAHAVQHPGRPGEVTVVMRGREGTGKGVAAKQFGHIFGSHFLHIVHAKHLVGHFNAHLQQCSVLFADEAFFAGDRQHESILKSLITEESLMIEPKGVDPFPVMNCVHLIMSSNAEWVIPAGADARRYFVLNVSDARMQDHRYFAAIIHQMENGGGKRF
jgi:Mesyanzhinovviridae DNA primase